MREYEKEQTVVCKEALKNVGALIEADAKTTLRREDIMASNKLINSVSVKEGRNNEIKVGTPMKYAYFVEFGRKAGKWPPARFIRQWILDNKIETEDVDDLTFLIQRSIGQKGKRPQPFLRPAYEKNKPSLVKVLKAGAAKIFNKDYSKR